MTINEVKGGTERLPTETPPATTADSHPPPPPRGKGAARRSSDFSPLEPCNSVHHTLHDLARS